MGLAISTEYLADLIANDAEGAAWFGKQLGVVNTVLAVEGLPAHTEPKAAGAAKKRRHVSSFPYSFLHYLRRAFAKAKNGRALTEVGSDEDPSGDPDVDSLMYDFDCHLLSHSDAEGYYVPIPFTNVLSDDGLPGGFLGSSVKLLDELRLVAPSLGITLAGGELPDAEAARLATVQDGDPFFREKIVWLALFENARVSIANRTLLVFH